MGSEKKSSSRKRRTSQSSFSEDENERSRKHSKRDGEKERKNRKHDDKERKKRKRDNKSHEHLTSREAKDKKTKGKHKHSEKISDSVFMELSDEDYFSKNNEFSTWLKEERGIFFSDLSSEAARDLFLSFIKAWNRQKLQPKYYDGIASAPRTAHNWKIKPEK